MQNFNKTPLKSETDKHNSQVSKIHESKHYYTPKHQYDDSLVCEPRTATYEECCNS